jgi:hypothetical protein
MNIVIQYDSSAANAPAGFQTAVQAAVNYLDNLITTPITVPITFSYGEIQGQSLSSGAIGQNSHSGGFVSYSQLKSALTTAATSADDNASVQALPATDPTNGGQFFVTAAQAAALHISGISAATDGFVGLSSNFSYSFDPNNRAQSGKYDAIGVLEHEITEVLGRDGSLGSWTSGGKPVYESLDLFRYSSAGAHQLSPGAGYFSVDGHTMLTPFNNPSNGGDAGDWASSVVGDSFGDASPDTVGQVTATDQRVLDVLGYTLSGSTSTPPQTTTPSGPTEGAIASTPTTASHAFLENGRSDILIQNAQGALAVGEVGANGQEAYANIGSVGSEWSFHGAGAFTGDGHDQYLMQNASGYVAVGELQNGKASYTTVSALGSEWSIESTGDYLGHGKSDVLVKNASGAVDVGEVGANGAMAFTKVAALGSEWRFKGSGDFTGSGHDQFLVQNAGGSVAIGDVQNGQTHYTTVAALGSEWGFEGVGKFMGDGKSQFVIENSSGAVALAEVGANGQVSYTNVAGLGSEWKFKGTGDFLGEGHDQIALQNTSGQVVVADVQNGHLHYTTVGALGSEWSFHM